MSAVVGVRCLRWWGCVICGGGVSSAVVGGGASSLAAVLAVPLVVVHRGGRCGGVGLLLLWLVGAIGAV